MRRATKGMKASMRSASGHALHRAKVTKLKLKSIAVTESSGNVFADIGLAPIGEDVEVSYARVKRELAQCSKWYRS
jgi:hypothetical protein